jgi:hypothetical protein
MHVEQLFVETLVDIDQKLRNNPSEYDLLKVSGLLRPILLDRTPLLDAASAATSLDAKFRVIKPAPFQPSPEQDAAWATFLATNPDVERVNVAVGIRGGLLTGEASQTGDQVLDLSREDFLKHPIGFTLMDIDYSVESVLRVAANSLGGIHNDGQPNHHREAEELRKYMGSGGATWFGRSMPAGMTFEIARCTLRACQPIADELARLGLYSPASSEWVWSVDGAASGLHSQTLSLDPGPRPAQ